MRDRFKFLRRPPSGVSPASKKRRINSEVLSIDPLTYNGDSEPYDEEEFDDDVKVIRLSTFQGLLPNPL